MEDEPEDEGEDDDQHGHEELLLGEREDPEVDLVLVHERQRLHGPRGQREATDHDRLEHEQQAHGRDDLGEDGRVAQRSEDQPMDGQAEDDAESQRQSQCRPERHRSAKRDGARPVRQVERVTGLEPVDDTFDERQRVRKRWHEEVTLGAQPGIDIGDVHGDRAAGEVDDPRTKVGEHNAESDGRDQRALGDPVAGDEALTEIIRTEDGDEDDTGEDQHHRLGGGSRRSTDCQPSGVTSIGSPFSPLRMLTHSPSMYC